MDNTQFLQSPVDKFVLLMVCLSIIGSFLAGMHYFTIDIPAQKEVHAPKNAYDRNSSCNICELNCGTPSTNDHYFECTSMCVVAGC